ncbi:MAG: Hsp20/alpha crystallin family protein [Planctomycetes bacterium]|nr:Hsp20/alpha crystallin family protein [Planctomycetota bacterium]
MLARCIPAALPMTDLSHEVDRVFNEVFRGMEREFPMVAESKPFPALNVWHDEKAFYVEAELPGFTMENIEISLVGPELTLTAARRIDSGEEGATFLRRERVSGSFSRTIRLPVIVDPEKVTAKLTNGVLTVSLPKAPEALPRKIAVTTA